MDASQAAPTQGVETALQVLGGKWKVLIVWHLLGDTQRYGALRRLIPAITEKMLIRQLRELERDGIIARISYQSIPPRVEYRMTTYGHSLSPILDSLCQWGWSHLQHQQDSPRIERVDATNLMATDSESAPET
jgi:DNA-binding HxlR family transcriptional regulator